MRKLIVTLAGIVLLLSSAAAGDTQLAADDSVRVETGITYFRPQGKVLNLDIARPRDGAPARPGVICLYGGGWISGSRSGMAPHLRFFASSGFVAVAPSYRLAPEHPFPAAAADVRNAVRWLRSHAKTHGVDPEHIGVMGFSAGGHLACLVGVTTDENRFGPDDAPQFGTSPRVQAVVNFFGPGNLASRDWSALAVRKYLVPFLEGTVDERPGAYKAASPITYISADDPPILTFQGGKDLTVPPSIARDLHARLADAGVPNRLEMLPVQGHGWKDPLLARTLQQSVDFFNEHLRVPATTTSAPE